MALIIVVVVVTFDRFLVKREISSDYHALRQWRWRLADFPCWEEKSRENRFVIVDWNAFWLDNSRGCTLENEVTFISFFISFLPLCSSCLHTPFSHWFLKLRCLLSKSIIMIITKKEEGKKICDAFVCIFLYSHSCVFLMQKFFDFPFLFCLSLVHFHSPFSYHLAMPCPKLIIITRQPPLTLSSCFFISVFCVTTPKPSSTASWRKEKKIYRQD